MEAALVALQELQMAGDTKERVPLFYCKDLHQRITQLARPDKKLLAHKTGRCRTIF